MRTLTYKEKDKMEKRKKHTKFWDMVDPETKRIAERFIERIRQGKIINIHRLVYNRTKCRCSD